MGPHSVLSLVTTRRMRVQLQMVTLLLLLPAGALGQGGPALTPGHIRGGWIADVDGERHVYLFKVTGTEVTGTYCYDCIDPENLAFVMDGTLGADAIHFDIVQSRGPGDLWREPVVGTLTEDTLTLTSARIERLAPIDAPRLPLVMQREPRRPAIVLPQGGGRGAATGGGRGGRGGYMAQGPNESLTPEKMSGLWVAGNGPDKQHFMFRHGGIERWGWSVVRATTRSRSARSTTS